MRATTSSPLARRRGACALALPLAGVLWAAAPAAPAPSAPREVATSRSGALVTAVASLPGRLLAAAVARADGGRYGLALLVEGDAGPTADSPGGVPATSGIAGDPGGDARPSGPRSVLFFDPGSSELVTVAASVPGRVNALAALAALTAPPVPDNRADQLILGEPGVLYAIDPPWGPGTAARSAAGCRKLLEAPGLDLRSVHGDSEGAPRPRLPWLPVARAGRLELLAGDGASPTPRELRPLASFLLPQTAKREPWGIKLTSSPVQLLPAASAEPAPPRFAVGPESQGGRRARTLLVSATPGSAPVEAWSLLPSDQRELEETSYAIWNGKPALLLSAVPKLGIFVKRDLHLFLLARDRSRGGSPPLLSVHTECTFWHPLRTYFAAAGGGGGADLVLIHPEGLRGKKLRFQVHPDLGQGRLAAQAHVSSLDVEADDWFYGADFSGDGVPDLLVRSQGRLLLYPGLAKAYRLADRPTWSYALPAPRVPPAAKRERQVRVSVGDDDEDRQAAGGDEAASGGRLAALVDLRGDGRAMLLLGVPGEPGHTVIVAVRRGGDPPR